MCLCLFFFHLSHLLKLSLGTFFFLFFFFFASTLSIRLDIISLSHPLTHSPHLFVPFCFSPTVPAAPFSTTHILHTHPHPHSHSHTHSHTQTTHHEQRPTGGWKCLLGPKVKTRAGNNNSQSLLDPLPSFHIGKEPIRRSQQTTLGSILFFFVFWNRSIIYSFELRWGNGT